MRRYRAIWRSPHVAALISSALLGRLPVGINALAIVLYLREQTGSFAIAGAVAGTLSAGSGVGAPGQGRRGGQAGPRPRPAPFAAGPPPSPGGVVGLTRARPPAA